MQAELIAGFDNTVFCEFLNQKFAGSFSSSRSDVPVKDGFDWECAERLGVVKTLAGPNGANMPLLVVAAKLPAGAALSERSSRLKQFNFARQVLDQAMSTPSPGVDGVLTQGLFVFHDDNGNFRLSLVYGRAEGTKLVWSMAKRLSFYVEAGQPNKTFRDRMALPWTSFDKLKEAFSVEKLTREFYNRLFAWYQWALSDEINVTYPNNTDTVDDEREINEHIIRLITRLMFVWFLKQKHLVPDTLFDTAVLKRVLKNFDPLKGDNYYRAVLQNLFFATLNSEISERAFAVDAGSISANKEHFGIKTLYRYGSEFTLSPQDVLNLFAQIPFLNGGLFECLDRDRDYYDGFSRNPKKQACIPNRLFFDEAKGLIPLLQQYNFTVEENSPGDEEVALDPELLGKVFENLLGAYNPETKIAARNATGSFYTPREIVNYMVDESLIAHLTGKCGEEHAVAIRKLFTERERPADRSLCRKMDEALVTAKILDPACGSGAFPMGILLRMVELLRILRNIPEEASVYDLKLELIENCIYGGDIQCIAVQISKLRFFISLVCEQKPTSDAKDNYGIHTLPNLETKFVAADSLIGLPKDGNQLPMANVENLKKDLWEVRHKHFMARSHSQKKELRREDKRLRTELAKALEDGGGFDTESASLMAGWDPYDQNTSAPFSDPEWMFNVKDGFDVVIGNPPYARNLSNEQKKQIKQNFVTATYQVDLYVAFIELSCRLTVTGGFVALITPNSWLKNLVMAKLRQYILEKLCIRVLVARITGAFNEAVVENAILIAEKAGKSHKFELLSFQDGMFCTSRTIDQERFLQNDGFVFDVEVTDDVRGIVSKLHDTKETVESLFEINRGINPYDALTGQSKAVIKSRAYHSDFKKDETFVPELKGRHVKPFSYNWDGKHFISYGSWLAAPRDPKFFSGTRIIFREILAQRLVCTIIDEDFKIDRSLYIAIPKNNSGVDIRYVLGLLASKLFSFYIRHKINEFDELFPKVRVAEFRAIPLKIFSIQTQATIAAVVDRILALKKSDSNADTAALEAEIDKLVYDLYGLTEEEVAIVEGSTGIPACAKGKQTGAKAQTGMSVPRATRKRKPQLPPSLPGWD